VGIKVHEVSVVFQNKINPAEKLCAIDHVSFEAQNGEILSILGPNGCGKSTLLLVISGLLEPTTGFVEIPSGNSGDPPPRKAVVFQDFGLFHWMTVWKNVEFGLKALRRSPAEREEIVRKFVDLVGLRGFEKAYPRQLSVGMQQRVGIARALAVAPDFLFLDEPFASLDLQTRDLMQEEFLRIWQGQPLTTILVTHSIEEAIYLGHKVTVLTRRPGRIKLTLTVPFPYPRKPGLRLTRDFLEVRSTIWNSLREEIEAPKN
jgi:ABC-type nitrate/sulfonate/bicarbonate transport system ATPase subunit